jgi:RNA polymerase sigma-70 factor, ECF subfamily
MTDDGRNNSPDRDPDLADALAASTDPAAFGGIYERHVGRIYAYAIQRLHDPALAEDATATTFSRALAAIERFQPRSTGRTQNPPTVGGWLLTIARNVVIDLAQERRDIVALDIDDYTTLLASREPGPARTAELNDDRQRIFDAVRRLSATQRRIVVLRFQGWKSPEIAELLNMSPGAVRVAQHRAFLKLRDLLDPSATASNTEEHQHA